MLLWKGVALLWCFIGLAPLVSLFPSSPLSPRLSSLACSLAGNGGCAAIPSLIWTCVFLVG
eukprot:m.266468 g.266468  ORF g.266468 m.266468 type:complete len:61 (+) comp65809_c0_seq1:114-296(+)